MESRTKFCYVPKPALPDDVLIHLSAQAKLWSHPELPFPLSITKTPPAKLCRQRAERRPVRPPCLRAPQPEPAPRGTQPRLPGLTPTSLSVFLMPHPSSRSRWSPRRGGSAERLTQPKRLGPHAGQVYVSPGRGHLAGLSCTHRPATLTGALRPRRQQPASRRDGNTDNPMREFHRPSLTRAPHQPTTIPSWPRKVARNA